MIYEGLIYRECYDGIVPAIKPLAALPCPVCTDAPEIFVFYDPNLQIIDQVVDPCETGIVGVASEVFIAEGEYDDETGEWTVLKYGSDGLPTGVPVQVDAVIS